MKKGHSRLYVVCIVLFVVGIISFLVMNILQLFVKEKISLVVFSVLSMLSQILISTGGITFLVEVTSLKRIVDSSVEQYSKKKTEERLQMDYMKECFNEKTRRELLFLSYLNAEDYDILKGESSELDLVSGSYEKILSNLIKTVYAKEDTMHVTCEVQGKEIVKEYERTLVLINLFGVENHFNICYAFNDIDGDSDLVNLIEFKLNDEILSRDDIIKKVVSNSSQSTYKYNWNFDLAIPGKEARISYKLKTRTSINDKCTSFTSKYMVKNLNHTIAINQTKDFNDVNVVLFSLVGSMTDKEVLKYDRRTYNGSTLLLKIEGREWLFPSDGYVLSFS